MIPRFRRPQGVSADDPPIAPGVQVLICVIIGIVLGLLLDYLIGG